MFTLENTKDATHIYWSDIINQWHICNVNQNIIDFDRENQEAHGILYPSQDYVRKHGIKLKRKKKDKKKFFNKIAFNQAIYEEHIDRKYYTIYNCMLKRTLAPLEVKEQPTTREKLFYELWSIVESTEVLGNRAVVNALALAIQSNKLPGVTFKA